MIKIKIQADGGSVSYPRVQSVILTKDHKIRVSFLSGEESRIQHLDLSYEHYEITITGDPFAEEE